MKDELIGQTFGDFYLYDFNYEKAKSYKYYYKCRCIKCGKEKEIQSSTLKNGKCIKCTCNPEYNKYTNIKGYKEDLSGKIFGNLTVNSFNSKKDSHSLWNCTCNLCGNNCVRNVTYLKTCDNPMCQDCAVKFGNDDRKPNNIKNMGDYCIINEQIYIDKEDLDKILDYHRYISINTNGYAYLRYNQQDYFIHRLIMNIPCKYNNDSKIIVDHINGNRLDNRKSNLRICTKNLNPINCKLYKNNSSGCKGVNWNKRLKKWEVNIYYKHQHIYLGIYANYEEAVSVRKEAEKKYFKEYNRAEEYL